MCIDCSILLVYSSVLCTFASNLTTGVHQSGRFVIVSNRGHESIAIFRVKQGCGSKGKSKRGTLAQVGFFHTRGETPRHFQFDHSGQFLIVANQDSDTIAIFTFNLTSGEIKYTGNEVSILCGKFEMRCITFVM